MTQELHSQEIFKKVANKINLIRKLLKVNTMSGASLGPIGIAPLDLNKEDQHFTHNICVHKIEAAPNLRTGFCSKI